MPNITMTVDGELLKKVRRVAAERNRTLTSLVRDYLSRLASAEQYRAVEAARELARAFKGSKMAVGRRRWRREDLYD